MDETISRQEALNILDEQIELCNKALGSFDISIKDEYAIKVERASLKAYKEQLENLPIVKPKCGKWIHDGTTCYCSECKKSPHRDYNKWDVFSPGIWILSDFCPKCGADMRGERNE